MKKITLTDQTYNILKVICEEYECQKTLHISIIKCPHCKKYFNAAEEDEWEIDVNEGTAEYDSDCPHCEKVLPLIITANKYVEYTYEIDSDRLKE